MLNRRVFVASVAALFSPLLSVFGSHRKPSPGFHVTKDGVVVFDEPIVHRNRDRDSQFGEMWYIAPGGKRVSSRFFTREGELNDKAHSEARRLFAEGVDIPGRDKRFYPDEVFVSDGIGLTTYFVDLRKTNPVYFLNCETIFKFGERGVTDWSYGLDDDASGRRKIVLHFKDRSVTFVGKKQILRGELTMIVSDWRSPGISVPPLTVKQILALAE